MKPFSKDFNKSIYLTKCSARESLMLVPRILGGKGYIIRATSVSVPTSQQSPSPPGPPPCRSVGIW